MTIERYDENGNENLDWWFGVRNSNNTIVEDNNKQIDKPRYVRYTLKNLKKRSTKRLQTMHYNLFSKLAERSVMIANLYRKLNQLWDMYSPNPIKTDVDVYGISYMYFDGDIPGQINKVPRGRPMKFETEMQVRIIHAEYCMGATLKELGAKYGVNIATLSQTFNNKGKYASWLFGEDDIVQ